VRLERGLYSRPMLANTWIRALALVGVFAFAAVASSEASACPGDGDKPSEPTTYCPGEGDEPSGPSTYCPGEGDEPSEPTT
jgi:hypothetical protein